MKNNARATPITKDEPTRRLLVVTSTFPRWKGDREPPFVYELCLRLADHYAVYVLAPHCPGARCKETMGRVRVHRFRYFFEPLERLAYAGGIMNNLKKQPWLGLLVPWFLLAQTLAVFQLTRTLRVHAVHAHWLFPQGFTALAAVTLATLFRSSRSGSRPALVCTSHGGDLYGLKGGLFTWVKRTVIARADAVAVVSQSMKTTVHRLVPEATNLHVMPMGVELTQRFVPPAERTGPPRLLFAGRLVDQKGLQYLLEALPYVRARHPRVRLWVAGSGPQQRQMTAKATELGLDEAVRFFGAVHHDELPRLYQAAHIVVFPSVEREGFGLVLVEAMGCACAVVATDLPAVQELLADGKHGLVVPGKDPSRLAAAVNELLDDPTKMQALGDAGRRFVAERFSWERTGAGYAHLIGTVIDDSKRTSGG